MDDVLPVHLEALLASFALGCILKRRMEHEPHIDNAGEGYLEGLEDTKEQHVATIITAIFMVLVGLSMPVITIGNGKWGILLGHVV